MVGTETKVAVNKANIDHLSEKVSRIEGICEKILEQVKYTNGRVNKLEKWQSYIGGAFAAIATILAAFGIKIF